jgi:hypothetical protein
MSITPTPTRNPFTVENAMTTPTATNISNGSQRRTLASQLDRLDTILDALSDGLHQAVTSAVQDAVERAVREALQQTIQGLVSEVLTNPDALALLRATLAPEPAPAPPPPTPHPAQPQARGTSFLSRAWGWACKGLNRAREACAFLGRQAVRLAQGACTLGRVLGSVARAHGKQLLAAGGVAALIAVLAYCAGPTLNALAAGVGGFATALLLQVRTSLGRFLSRTSASA